MKFSEFLQESNTYDEGYIADRPAIEVIEDFNAHRNLRGDCIDIAECKLKTIPVQIRDMPDELLHVFANQLSTFENFPKHSLGIDISDNKFTTLHNIHKYIKSVKGTDGINLHNNKITSHILGLLLITDLKCVWLGLPRRRTALTRVEKIINSYLPNTRGNDAVLDCQNELIDAGLEEYAQL